MGAGENPKTLYGRLLESAHISSYTFERVCSELEILIENDRWLSVGNFTDINAFLKSIDLSAFNLGDKRPRLVKRIKELQPQASQRAIAQAVGVGVGTVNRDLGNVPNGTPATNEPTPVLDPAMEVFQMERPAEPLTWLSRDASGVAKAAKKGIAANYSSETNEWYTPAVYVEAARRAMGSIDLDPASVVLRFSWNLSGDWRE